VPPPDSARLELLLSEIGWLDSLARTLAREPELAEETVQETYLAALQRGPAHAANLRGWLATVARNVVRKRRRGEARRRAREEAWSDGRPREVSAEEAERAFALRHDLARAVLALDGPLRQAVVLRFVHGLSLREVAERLDAPLSTVDGHVRRALGILRARLERDGRFDPRSRALLLVPLARRARAALLAVGLSAAALVALVAVQLPRAPRGALAPSGALAARASGRPEVAASLAGAARIARAPASAPFPGPPAGGSLTVNVRDRAGQPVAGVFVRPWLAETSRRRPLLPGRRTDSRGRAEWGELEAGRYRLAFDRLRSIEVTVEPGRESVATRTLAGRAARGVVVDAGGAPIAGAELWLSPQPAGWFEAGAWVAGEVEDVPVARTDAEGGFAIPALGDAFLLGVRASGFAPGPTLRLSSLAEHLEDLRVTLAEPGGRAAGQVLDPEGRPLAGALVTCDGTSFGAPLLGRVTDGTGRFELDGVPRGDLALRAWAPGLAAWRGTLEVPERGDAFLVVRLESGPSVSGTVRDEAGQPIAGAHVFAAERETWRAPDPWEGGTTFTDGAGRFTLRGLARAPRWVSALAVSGARCSTRVEPPAEIDLVAACPAELRGRVVDGTGRGIAACVVSVASDRPWSRPSCVTAADGGFKLPAREAGPQLVRVLEHGTLVHEGATLAGRETVIVIPDHVRPRTVLTGSLHGLDGDALEGARLVLEDVADGRVLEVPLALEAGRFASRPVGVGTYRVRVVAGAAAFELPALVSIAGQAPVDLGALELAPVFDAELAFEHDGPLRDLVLVLRDEAGRTVLERSLAEPAPYLPIRARLSAGRYELLAWSATTVPVRRELVVEGRSSAWTVRLVEGEPRELVVRTREGAPLFERLHLVLAGEDLALDTLVAPSLKDPGGAYRVRLGLSPGEYRLACTAGGRALSSALRVGPADAPPRIELTLE